jgi:hypothetical protein
MITMVLIAAGAITYAGLCMFRIAVALIDYYVGE